MKCDTLMDSAMNISFAYTFLWLISIACCDGKSIGVSEMPSTDDTPLFEDYRYVYDYDDGSGNDVSDEYVVPMDGSVMNVVDVNDTKVSIIRFLPVSNDSSIELDFSNDTSSMEYDDDYDKFIIVSNDTVDEYLLKSDNRTLSRNARGIISSVKTGWKVVRTTLSKSPKVAKTGANAVIESRNAIKPTLREVSSNAARTRFNIGRGKVGGRIPKLANSGKKITNVAGKIAKTGGKTGKRMKIVKKVGIGATIGGGVFAVLGTLGSMASTLAKFSIPFIGKMLGGVFTVLATSFKTLMTLICSAVTFATTMVGLCCTMYVKRNRRRNKLRKEVSEFACQTV